MISAMGWVRETDGHIGGWRGTLPFSTREPWPGGLPMSPGEAWAVARALAEAARPEALTVMFKAEDEN